MFESMMNDGAFKAREIGLRAQKKILSRMATKNVAKALIDDTTGSLLDNLYRLAKLYSNNKKEAEKLIKNIIKIVIKISILHRNNQFTSAELKEAENFKSKFHSAEMAVISFYEMDFSYDRNYLQSALWESQKSLRTIVASHLTDKTLARIDMLFDFFTNEQFLDAVFLQPTADYRELLGRLVADLNKTIDHSSSEL